MNFQKLIIKNIKKNKKIFAEFSLCFALASCALSINPYFISRIIGCFNIGSKELVLHDICFWLSLFIIFKILQAIVQYFVRITKETFSTMLISNIVSDLFKQAHCHNLRYFDDEMTVRISTAITKTASLTQSMLAAALFALFRPLINFCFAFGIICFASPKLGLTLACICLPFFFVLKIMDKKIRQLWHMRGTAERDYLGYIGDSVTNYKLVRYTGSLFTEKLKAYAFLKKYLRISYDCESLRALYSTILFVLETTFTITCYFSILYFSIKENLSLADAFFAFSAVSMLNSNLNQLNRFWQEYSQDRSEIASHLELIYQPIEIKDKPDAKPLKISKATINFRHINFAYTDDKNIFNNLNLTIPAGQKVGLVGLSGAGKSTLINLLLRSYLPQSGQITINKKDLADITETSLHKNIAYVPQDVTLFNRSLYENLKIANPKADKKQIIKASQLAYIDDTIKKLDNGYDSIVGERGILLSGGERQRIAIARAILQDAPILILDEATSALDSEAEIMVQKAIENLMKEKTVIAIAHRLSTLRSMDRIIVLDNGKIIEDDTPQNLLSQKESLFKHLFELQTDGYLNTSIKGETK